MSNASKGAPEVEGRGWWGLGRGCVVLVSQEI